MARESIFVGQSRLENRSSARFRGSILKKLVKVVCISFSEFLCARLKGRAALQSSFSTDEHANKRRADS